MILTLGLAAGAGLLSILSPCVLPLVPLVIGAALGQHRWGPLALAGGLAASFTLAGIVLATIGTSLGLDPETVRKSGAVLLLAAGLILSVPVMGRAFATAAGPLAGWANQRIQDYDGAGVWGQAGLGAMLGLMWAPCVGPTLGAALSLSTQTGGLLGSSLVMAAFGLGAGMTLAGLGLVSRHWLRDRRTGLTHAAEVGKRVLGFALIGIAFLTLTGLDKLIEAQLLGILPAWLIDLTTAI